ncbi:Glycosyl transferase, group 2 family protein [hydrothermal vent metagenome]|uniref:Glycosyl transferase, group 2 family protein n=1 Tax=hydrothermal vent metagenome TaxID=652676 RepID=A0A3B1DUG6_9ZZZZ
MKILYVKNNSERAREFQLKTIIYEQDGKKYIKKQAIFQEAIPHLMRMKDNYKNLTSIIVNPKLKLAKIIEESDNSLTFEFIEGESLEEKYNTALQINEDAKETVINEYISLITNSFKTIQSDNVSLKNEKYNLLFGNLDLSNTDGELYFDSVSNIDLIFSNIIYKNEYIYIIDYEWVFDLSLPVNYIIHRTLTMIPTIKNSSQYIKNNNLLYMQMERHFVDQYVMNNGFYFKKHQYIKTNAQITEHIKGKEAHIKELLLDIENRKNHINKLEQTLTEFNDVIADFNYNVKLRDEQIKFLFELINSLRLKSRIKKFIPKALLVRLGYQENKSINIKDYPLTTTMDDSPFSRVTTYNFCTPIKENNTINTLNGFKLKPLISIIMPVYNVDPKWLDLAIKSIENQWYENWELCIADDKSTNHKTLNYLKKLKNSKIKITYLDENVNISNASNAALELAQGEYIALMDNDDEITPNALYEIVKSINEYDPDFIYSDEDFISMDEKYINPHYKPDFSPDLLLSHNYITHFTCFKKELLNKVGYFNSEFDGSQDYDLFLRLTEKTSKIHHIQKVLYHWRMLETSTSSNSEAKPEAIERGKLVLESALKRRNISASVLHANLNHYFRVKYVIKNEPLVSIIIPFKDRPELLSMSINSVLNTSTYKNYEIIGISNNSQEQATFDMMQSLEAKDSRVKFYEYNTEFNYADINNHAVNTYAKGEQILLLNNDIEVITPDWIEAMLEFSQRDDVGCVGAKLYYPNETIQHAGIIIGLGGYAAHSHREFPRDNPGYFNRLNIVQNLSSVTAACLMIKKRIYHEVEGMNSVQFKIAYNDVDFTLRVREKGYLNIFTPYAEMYHHESLSRGEDTTPEQLARFQTEKDALYKRHTYILDNGDPYYNPNLTLDREDFSYAKQIC